MILAGDIGGTKTDLALFSTDSGPRAPLAQEEFQSRHYAGIEPMVREFLGRVQTPVECACLDVAGPVIDGAVRTTNLPWFISEESLRRELGLAKVRLLNDLEAIASAVPSLGPDDVRALAPGEPVLHGTIAVVAPGTGLGEAFLIWDGSRYRPCSSEGGHADFAPADATQSELLEYMRERYDHVSFERVCSAIGIPALYDFFRDRLLTPEGEDVAAALAAAEDKAHVIIDAALHAAQPDPLCTEVIELFASILGSEAGNLALKVLATGGVYLAGGIPMHVLPALEKGTLAKSFQRKGRLAKLLSRIPVQVITGQAALMGAAIHGLELAGHIGTD